MADDLELKRREPIESEGGFLPSVESAPENDVEMGELVPELQEDIEQEVIEREVHEAPTVPAPVVDDQVADPQMVALKRIEDILSQDLTQAYLALPEDKKNLFKQKGEEVAQKIQQMFEKGKVSTKKILQWIKEWLMIIPGVNKYFLEQEAKIKTDNVLQFWEEENSSRLT